MKKILLLAIILSTAGCYTPLNNSGVATNKSWLDIAAKKTDFQGKQYDSCYQFRLRFMPAEAEAQLDLQDTCISNCCWRSDKEEVVLDFNKNFEQDLKFYGRAEKYSPDKITLKITHSNLLNTSAVHVTPRGAIRSNGTVRLKHQTVEDPVRLAQIEEQSRRMQAQHNAWLADQQIPAQAQTPAVVQDPKLQQRAQELVQRQEGTRIDQHFYLTNKAYQQKGYIFLVSQRLYSARALPNGTYRVSCHAQVQSGAHPEQLKSRSLSCGIWSADLDKGTVTPQDSVARKIKAQNQ